MEKHVSLKNENTDLFPAHRNQGLNTADAGPSITNWWGTTIVRYGGGRSNLFHYPAIEGVEPKRHLGMAVVSFNDGHSEARKSETINPPANPADRTAKALINSRDWDPRQRGGDQ